MSQKACMSCRYAHETEIPVAAQALLVGQDKPRVCIRNPPVPMAFRAGAAGGHVIAAVYPPVSKDTVSCGEYKVDAVELSQIDAAMANYVGATINNLKRSK